MNDIRNQFYRVSKMKFIKSSFSLFSFIFLLNDFLKLIVVSIFLPSFAIAQIHSGTSFVGINRDMDFSANIETNNLICQSNYLSCVGVYPCTTKTNNIDFSVQDKMVSTCICPCVAPVVSSPKPFFISKKGFYVMDLSNPLNLSDTSLFLKIDTINNQQGYLTGCYLPFNALYPSDSTIIIKTNANNYVLIQTMPVLDSVSRGEQIDGCTPYFGGYNIHWFLQQNGTTDFSGVDQTNIAFKFPLRNDRLFTVGADRYTLSRKASLIINVYDLKGRLIKSIVNQKQQPGSYKFELPTNFSHGSYIVSLSAAGRKIDRLVMAGK